MHGLTESGREAVARIAGRQGLSEEAVAELARALAVGGGRQAQFSHPDLGGMGQWSQGGMVMVGDMFNNALKAQVDAACNDLVAEMARAPILRPAAPRPATGWQGQSQSQGSGAGSSFSLSGGYATSGWPEELGQPSSVGSQNNLRYAVFPQTRRLAIDVGGRIEVFDIGDHNITGFSQQQSGDQSITFTSQHGLVRVADLRRVPLRAGGSGERSGPARHEAPPTPEESAPSRELPPKPAAAAAPTESARPEPAPAPASPPAAGGAGEDVFGMIEKLGALRDKGLISDEEFAAKKSELLGRL